MKKVRWKITVILVAAALCGCVNDPTENGVAEDLDTGSRKVLTAPNAVNGELLVKFSDEAIAAVESGVTRSGATRTGIQPFDAALNTLGAISMKRVFPYVEKDEADARALQDQVQSGNLSGQGFEPVGGIRRSVRRAV